MKLALWKNEINVVTGKWNIQFIRYFLFFCFFFFICLETILSKTKLSEATGLHYASRLFL